MKTPAAVSFKYPTMIAVFILMAAALALPFYSVRSSSVTGTPPEKSGSDSPIQLINRTPIQVTNTGLTPFLVVPQTNQSEGIAVYAADCTTPKTSFVLGETVCAIASNSPTAGALVLRRFSWAVRAYASVKSTNITTATQNDSFTLPTTAASVVNGETIDNRSVWRVCTADTSDSSIRACAYFSVSDPATPAADMGVGQGSPQTSGGVAADTNVIFTAIVTNDGPDSAQQVALTTSTPANTSPVSAAQISGSPSFTCSTSNGTTTCTTTSAFPPGGTATFAFTYHVNSGTPKGTQITNQVSVAGSTTELEVNNNSSSFSVLVTAQGTATDNCTVTCPEDVSKPADTTDGNGNPGAIVHFPAPSGDAECGTIGVNHCNDCFFPVGTTVVTATATTGDTCDFNVVVTPPNGNPPTISCPANQSGDANASCSATFSVGTASATGGSNVTITANRSDGEPMYTCDDFGNCTRITPDRPFSYGETTITWIATSHDIPGPYNAQTGDEDSHQTGSTTCTQIITVNDVSAPTITATDQTASADANCQAAVPDYSDTVSDNCSSSVVYTQTPAAGALVGLGSHVVHIEVNDGSSNNNGAGNSATKDVTFTVNDTTAPTVTAPADSSASADASCQAAVPDYTAGSSASDNCDSSVTLTQSPAAGTMVGAGPHTVTVTGTDDASNQGTDTVVFTVNDTTAPTVTAPADSSASADANCQAAVPDYASASTTHDNCDSSVTLTQSPAAGTMVGLGAHTVTVTATDDAGNHSSDDVVFTVNDTTAPTVTAPPDSSASADANCEAEVPDYASASTTHDNCDSSVTVTQSPAAGTKVGLGPHIVTVTATDDAGNQSSDTVIFTVNDTTGPTITLNGQTQTMWPANHKYKTFAVADFVSGVSDNCSSNLGVSSVVVGSATSDETENGNGDGNTYNDIVISSDCKTIQLRAEREAGGDGRVYKIVFIVRDAAGNIGTATATVVVPKNPGQAVVDSGPHYAVTGHCP